MHATLVIFTLALTASSVLCSEATAKSNNEGKELIMLEFERVPVSHDDRRKRSSAEGLRYVRQAATLPPEYLNLLQQFSAQQQAGQQPQQPQQQQQQLIQELAVARDGSKQPAAARYVLTPDGRVVQEAIGLQSFALAQQQFLENQGTPQQQQQAQPGRPVLTPELEAFSRAQTQLQQDYHDAPLHAQIAGLTERPPPASAAFRNRPLSGPNSPAPQGFPQAAAQALALEQARLQAQAPSIAQLQAAGYQIDSNAFQLQQQQQIQQQQQQIQQQAQQQFAQQLSAASQSGRPLFDQSAQFQRVLVQQQPRLQQSQPQAQAPIFTPAPTGRRPIGPSASAQLATNPAPQQILPQGSPQQYIFETSRQAPSFSIGFSQQQQAQIQQQQQQQQDLSAFLTPTAGRGLFSPVQDKSSRSSIFVTRAGSKAATPVTQEEEKLPLVRIPSPGNQRPLSQSEFQALVDAGFNVTPVPEQSGLFKAKRAPAPPLERRNHVIYHNQQDGVSYQYSPGSSDYSPASAGKAKRFASPRDLNGEGSNVVTYVLALGRPA